MVFEIVLGSRWTPTYFRTGIVLFRQRIPIVAPVATLPEVRLLKSALRSAVLPSVLFRELSDDELGFRERFFEFNIVHYTPIMRGHVEVVPAERTIVVKGRLNWWTLAFIAWLPGLSGLEAGSFFMAFAAASVLFIYVIQSFRFRRVARILAEAQGPAC